MALTSESHNKEDRVQFGMWMSSDLGTGGEKLSPRENTDTTFLFSVLSVHIDFSKEFFLSRRMYKGCYVGHKTILISYLWYSIL